jgi:Golgi phosphoprotein 3
MQDALQRTRRIAAGRLPPEAEAKVREICHQMLGLPLQAGKLTAGSKLAFTIQRMATDYLPRTLEAYVRLSPDYATTHVLPDGRTPAQVLMEQLDLISASLDRLRDALMSRTLKADAARTPAGRGSDSERPTWTVGEQLLLLALDPRSGAVRLRGSAPFTALELALAGALLLELIILGRLDVDGTTLVVVDNRVTDNQLLNRVLGAVSAMRRSRSADYWVGRLQRRMPRLGRQHAEHLVRRGVLETRESRLFGMSLGRRYTVVRLSDWEAIWTDFRQAVFGSVAAGERMAALIGLAVASGLYESLVDRKERRSARESVKQVIGEELAYRCGLATRPFGRKIKKVVGSATVVESVRHHVRRVNFWTALSGQYGGEWRFNL